MRMKNPTDQELLDLLQKDASAGMKLLIDIYSGLIYYIVEKRLINRQQDIEECVSDIFLEFYEKLGALDLNKGSIKSYLAIIASRRALDRFRSISTRKEDELDNFDQLVDNASGPEQDLLLSERRKALLSEVKKLGEPDSTILYRRFFLTQSVSEIAGSINMKSNSVSKRISRALDTLRAQLEEYGYE